MSVRKPLVVIGGDIQELPEEDTISASSAAHASSHTNGTDDIQSATNAQKGVATAAQITAVETNTDKVTNAAHTGEVSGSAALTLNVTAISNKSLVTAVGTDHVVIVDATDGSIKKALISDFAAAGGNIVGPANAVDDRIATFDGVTGKLLQDGGKIVAELEPVITYPTTNGDTKYYAGDKTFKEIVIGSGGFAANVYLSNID